MKFNRVIVIGASTGGVGALCSIMQDLVPNLPAAILVVQHLGPTSVLPEVLSRCHPSGGVEAASDGLAIKPGHIYVAVPDRHLVVENGKMRLRKTPRENLHRPSVDVLFRSAARVYGNKVVGVVLTGALDDGASGLFAIKARGGIAVVQDPKDAQVAEMPSNALEAVRADYCVPVAQIAPLLVKLAQEVITQPSVKAESSIMDNNLPIEDEIHPAFVCPECDGPLAKYQNGKLLDFLCKIGHRFSLDSLSEAAAQALERGLWIAIRSLEDRAAIQRLRAAKFTEQNQNGEAATLLEIAMQAEEDAQILRQLMERL